MSPDLQAALAALRRGEEAARRRAAAELGGSGLPEAIAPLLGAVGDDSWGVRQAAVDALAGFARESLLPALEAALRDGEDAGLRNAAMEIYVRLGPAAAPPLLSLLRDADEEVRLFAAVMLGTLKEPSAVPALVDALSDADVNVRHAAATSLGQIGSTEAVPRLVEALRDEPWLQYPALHALGEIGDPRAAPALVELLGDELLRGPALEALGLVGDRACLARIAPHLLDPDPGLRNAAIRAVVEIEQRATSSGDSLDPHVQAVLRDEDLVTHLLGMLSDDDPRNRRTAAVTLGWLREPRATGPLIERLGDPPVREFASHALVSIGFHDGEAWQTGIAHADDAVRLGVVRCLAWIAPAGRNRARRAADPRPLGRGARRGGRRDRPAGRRGRADAAVRAARRRERADPGERDGGARRACSPERVRPLLVQALASGDAESQVRAAQTLGLMRDAGRRGRARRCRGKRARGRACGRAAGARRAARARRPGRAAGRAGGRQLARAPAGRARARAAARAGGRAPPDPAARRSRTRACASPPCARSGRSATPEAVPHLLPLLSDPRKELRFAAVEALGQIRAPAAVRPLLDVAARRRPQPAPRRGRGSRRHRRPAGASPRCWWRSRTSTGACAAPRPRRSAGSAAPRRSAALVARVDDPDATVRRAAVAALGEVGDHARRRPPGGRARPTQGCRPPRSRRCGGSGPPALPEIERALASGAPDAEVRRLLVDLAGRFDDAGRAPPAAGGARGREPRPCAPRRRIALGEGGFREALRPLLERKSSDPSAGGPAGRRDAPCGSCSRGEVPTRSITTRS